MTIYDIAKEAGVSASTISRVYNNKPGVKESTRVRINKLLEKFNYYPDAAARGLVSQSSKMIGILVSDIRTIHNTEGAYIIERELSKLGYHSLIFNTGSDEESKTESIRIMASRKVEAVVMMGSAFQTDEVKESIFEYLNGLPVVIVNGYIELPNVYGILADEKDGVANCVKFLSGKGRKNIAFINNTETHSNMLKEEGFYQEVKKLGLSNNPVIFHSADKTDISASYTTTKNLLIENPEIDGIIYATDLDAAFGLRALMDLNIKIPLQISVIGVDNSIYGEICYPRLTSLDNKILDLSTTCANKLTNILNNKKVAQKIMIFSELIERETT